MLLIACNQTTAQNAWSMRKETIHWVFYLRECTVWFTGSNNFLFFSFKKNYLLASSPVNSSSILGLVPLNPKICTRKFIICCLCISNISASQAATGKTNSRWPGCGAANINNGEKTKQRQSKKTKERQSKQTVYKELAASKKTFWKPPKSKVDLWIAHQLYPWSKFQAISISNKQFNQFYQMPVGSLQFFSTIMKSNIGRTFSATVHMGQKLWTVILQIWLRKYSLLFRKNDFCLPSWQKI